MWSYSPRGCFHRLGIETYRIGIAKDPVFVQHEIADLDLQQIGTDAPTQMSRSIGDGDTDDIL
jgi:hypothetical protein